MFWDRGRELQDLDRIWGSQKAGLVIVYGRRRVGKSTLLKFWCKDKPVLYWTATKTTGKRLLQSFSKTLQTFKNPDIKISNEFSYPNWESAFLDMASHSQSAKFIAVIDEFPYAIEAEPELPSLIQKIWDANLKDSKIILVLTGSRIGMVEKHILSSEGPLYGRASAIMWLDPLPLSEVHNFLPRYSRIQLVEVYAITGGVPLYIEIFDDSVSVLKNLKRELTSTTSILKGEPYFLLHEELKEPMRFIAILEAMGQGKKQLSEISMATGIEKTHLMPYFKTLEGLKYIKRYVPVTEDPKKSRKGVYHISDLFLKFYFRFIAPHQNLIEEGRQENILKIIQDNMDSFVGKNCFELLCRRWLASKAKKGELPFDPDVIGKYWDVKTEIDVAAISKKDRSMIIGEAKWTQKKCALRVLEDLNLKASHIQKEFGYHVIKFIFGRTGFTESLIQRARIEDVRLVDIGEIFEVTS